MHVEQHSDDATHLSIYAPALVLVFETEAPAPTVSFPRDPMQLSRILAELDPRWRDLLYAALEIEREEA